MESGWISSSTAVQYDTTWENDDDDHDDGAGGNPLEVERLDRWRGGELGSGAGKAEVESGGVNSER